MNFMFFLLLMCVYVCTCVHSCVWMRVSVRHKCIIISGQTLPCLRESCVVLCCVCPARWSSTSKDPPVSCFPFPPQRFWDYQYSCYSSRFYIGSGGVKCFYHWSISQPCIIPFLSCTDTKTWGELGKTSQSEAVSLTQMSLGQTDKRKFLPVLASFVSTWQARSFYNIGLWASM